MAEKTFKIENILGGQSPTIFFRNEGQFLSSAGIDPDLAFPGSPFTNRASGAIAPIGYAAFSGAAVNGAPMWIITNPKNNLVYTYLASGRLISYSSVLGSETEIGTPTSGAGNGAVYYNNYIYLMTPTDVSRYGPLNGTPALTNTVWTGATLGTQTALNNTAYLSSGVSYPNHAAHVHTDNALYFCDFVPNTGAAGNAGKGIIHKIKTIKVIDEGDTNDGSLYNALDLPFGYMPMDIESYGTDLAIVAIQTIDSTVHQGQSAMFLWDTISDSFYRQVPITDPLVSAIFNRNGRLHVFSGNSNNGFRVSQYLDGYSFQTLDFFEEGYSPFAGAVDGYGDRITFGGVTTEPVNAAVAFSLGYKSPHLPPNARHVPVRTSSSSSATGKAVTSLKYVTQASGIYPRIVIGYKDSYGSVLDKISGAATSVFRSEIFVVERPFSISRIRIPLSDAVGANTTIVPKLYFDNGTTTKTLATINNTNYSGNRIVNYKAQEIEETATSGYNGQHNFFIEFTMSGSDNIHILLPIEITVTILDD